ncbi:hypothetical protein Moror_2435, partial [Moniliophthora roreri MCA 2997]
MRLITFITLAISSVSIVHAQGPVHGAKAIVPRVLRRHLSTRDDAPPPPPDSSKNADVACLADKPTKCSCNKVAGKFCGDETINLECTNGFVFNCFEDGHTCVVEVHSDKCSKKDE